MLKIEILIILFIKPFDLVIVIKIILLKDGMQRLSASLNFYSNVAFKTNSTY